MIVNRFKKIARCYSLIELLVVLAILGILAAMATPVVISMLDERKAQRSFQEMKGIIQACKAFQTEYGRMPFARKYTEDMVTDDSKELTSRLIVEELLAVTSVENSREIRFLQWSDRFDLKKGVEGEDGEPDSWLDPWGTPYIIALDYDGDKTVELIDETSVVQTLNGSVFMVSAGPDRLISLNNFSDNTILNRFIEAGYDRNDNGIADSDEIPLVDVDNICSWK